MPAVDLLDRAPPADIESEMGVLGSIMLCPDKLDDVAGIIKPEDFHDDAHRKLYAACVNLCSDGRIRDGSILAHRLTVSGALDEAGGTAYVAKIVNQATVAVHAAYYARCVKDAAVRRNLITQSLETIHDAYDAASDCGEVMERAQQRAFAMSERSVVGEPVDASTLIRQSMDSLERRMSGEPDGVLTVMSGYAGLDAKLNGMRGGQLILMAGRPAAGKTSFALNVTANVSRSGEQVLFVSLEMSNQELTDRMLSSIGRVSGKRMKAGALTSDERMQLVEAANHLSQAALHVIDEPTMTVHRIAAHARRLKRRKGLAMLVVDYLQLIEPVDSRVNREQQVATIARSLKNLAKELGVPVLCLSQLSRKAEDDKKPRLHHLRESGSLEQDADVVIFVHRDEAGMTDEEIANKPDVRGQAEAIVAKQRTGPRGSIPLLWRADTTTFDEPAERRHAEFDDYNESTWD